MNEPFLLTLDGPGKNSLGTDLMTRTIAALREAGGRPVLLTGAGDVFSAGLNLKEIAGLDQAGMERYLLLLDDLIDALYDYPGPLVGCITGHAIAGGCVLALCCDYRVVADNPKLRIGLNEVANGLQFPPKIMALIRHRVPLHGVQRVTLEAALYDPATALHLGLVDEVAADAPAVAQTRLAALASHPAATYAATKRTLRGGVLALSAEAAKDFRERLVPAWCTPEVRARVLAALKPSR